MEGHDRAVACFGVIENDVTAGRVIFDKAEIFEPFDELFGREGGKFRHTHDAHRVWGG